MENIDLGVTNPLNGKIILSPRLMTAYEDNFTLAETVIHEMDHYNNFKFNYYQGNSKIAHDLNELSAYSAAAEWAGYMKKQGYVHARNVAIYFSLFHF